jgi:hypothetical protein
MSDVPPGYSDVPPGSSRPPRSGGPLGSEFQPPGSNAEAIKARVRGPAIFLLVVNALNLLAGVVLLLFAFGIKSDAAALEAAVAEAWPKLDPQQRTELENEGWNPRNVTALYGNSCLWEGGASAIIGVLGILAAVRMLRMQSYGIGLTGSILTAIPLASPCCLVGQIAGIWALIVLLNKDVRSAFH